MSLILWAPGFQITEREILLFIQGGFMRPVMIDDFVAFLKRLTVADFKGSAVESYLSECHVNAGSLSPYLHFRKETYGRNLIAKNENFELLALTWLPAQRTPIHDHSGQRCWMLLEEGSLCSKDYQPIAKETDPLVPLASAKTLLAGEHVYIDDSIGVHSLTNAGQTRAVSLHLYAGPIPRCRTYNEQKKRFEWTTMAYYTEYGKLVPASAA